MCSATFGDQMWTTRGVGLTRVLSAIRVRAGPTVKLVFESPNETVSRAKNTAKTAQAAQEARQRAQDKKDSLLSELNKDEKKLKKGKFLGLF
jgi:NACalpha-BTF3-like transcription factor